MHGTSFAHTLADASAKSRHVTQYYEMIGSRALYHDGWKAVVFHPARIAVYDGTDVSKPFDEDVWELYNVAEDFAEIRDLAASRPEKLAELKDLWWKEAERNQVLPLNNQPGRFGDRRFRRDRYVYHAGIGRLPGPVAPNLRNRKFIIEAHLNVPAGASIDGTLVAHGGSAGGYSLYLKGRRLHFVYNLLGMQSTTISASVELPAGRVVARAEFNPTGPFRGNLALFYDGVPVGEGAIARTTPVTYGSGGFAVGYQPGPPITDACPGRFTVPDGLVAQVVIEAEGAPYRDPAAEDRVAMSRQ